MVNRTRRILLYSSAAVCLLASLGILTILITVPISLPSEEIEVRSARQRIRISVSQPKGLESRDFQGVWRKAIQGPLSPTKPKKRSDRITKKRPMPQPPPSVLLKAELIGTLIDDQASRSRAWIEVAGKRGLFGEGDVLGDHQGTPVLRTIENQRVTIDFLGKIHALTLKRPIFVEPSMVELHHDQ